MAEARLGGCRQDEAPAHRGGAGGRGDTAQQQRGVEAARRAPAAQVSERSLRDTPGLREPMFRAPGFRRTHLLHFKVQWDFPV